MFTRILVPLDGSARAETAIPVAARLTRAAGGALILVEVANIALEYGPLLGPTPLPEQVIDRAYDETVAYLRAIARRPDLAGIATETEVLSGPVADTLLRAGQAHRADLIVLTSHGRSGLTRWALGSVAAHLARHAALPVLVLREPEGADASVPMAKQGVGRVVVPLDGSPLAEAALAPAAELARALAAPGAGALHLVCVVAPAPAADDELTPLLGGATEVGRAHDALRRDADAYLRAVAERPAAGGAGRPAPEVTREVVEARDVAAALIRSAEGAPGASAIALATHGRGAVARWALGSIAERMLDGTRLPTLVVRPASVAPREREAEAAAPGAPRPRRTAPLFPAGRHARPSSEP